MLRTYLPEPWPPRRTLDALDTAIQLIEDQISWTNAHSARMAMAGRDEDVAYARDLLEFSRSYLDLLRRSRQELLSRKRPQEKGDVSFGTLLGDALRGWRRSGRH
jgi:hypothetical protein